jgi:membrane protease YdiL (CAAX protease family)
MIQTLDLIALITALVLFVALLIPPVPTFFKKLYYTVNSITLNTQRRLYFSLIDGIIITAPSLLFVIQDIVVGKSPFKTIARNYLPLAAYVFFPIIIAWVRPLAANPLDICDIIILLGLIIPIIIQCVLDHAIFFDQAFKSEHLWIDFHSLYLIAGSLAVFIYSVLRPLPDLGLAREMKMPLIWDGVLTVLGLGLLLASLPILIYTDHAFDRVTNVPPIWVLVNFICVLIFVALPLELVFRGVIQNLFHARIEVYRDVKKFTVDSDTKDKIKNYGLFQRLYSRFSGRNSMSINSDPNYPQSRHDYHQTQELLELSLQLGAPAAQVPLQPNNPPPNKYKSFHEKKLLQNDENFEETKLEKKGIFSRSGDQYRESLLDTINNKNQSFDEIESSNNLYTSPDHHNVDFEPEPLLFNVPNLNKPPNTTKTSSALHPDSIALSTLNGSDPNATPLAVHRSSGGGGGVYAHSAVSSTRTSSVVYSMSHRHGTVEAGNEIKDTTSLTLGAGYVSKQDAELAAINAQEEYLFEMERERENEQFGRKSDNYGERSGHFYGLTKLDDVQFDTELFKKRQRGYGFTFEESPVWPTWQERHKEFYKKSFFHWFFLPTKSDYLCVLTAALIYAGALLYNIAYFIQYQRDGSHQQKFEPHTWFTLFLVLTWQGFICGFLWRMSSQIWPSVLVTAAFFTLGAFWLGIDG